MYRLFFSGDGYEFSPQAIVIWDPLSACGRPAFVGYVVICDSCVSCIVIQNLE